MTTTTMTTPAKTLTALALAAAALTVMAGPSEAVPRLQKQAGVHTPTTGVTGVLHPLPITAPPISGVTGVLHPLPIITAPPTSGVTGVHHPLPIITVPPVVIGPVHPIPIVLPPTSHPPISCFTCKLPHGGQGGARPPGYGWGYGNHWPYHGWGYGYYNWYRWHPAYYGGAPVAAAPVAPAPVAAMAAPSTPIGGCNCLTKQMLPNGAELLQDICTQQSAVAQPQALSAR
jgi:hypothetical protein